MKTKSVIKIIITILVLALIVHFLDFKEGGRWFSSTKITNIPDINHKDFEVDVVFSSGERVNAMQQLKLQHQFLQKTVSTHPEEMQTLITSDGWKELKSSVYWFRTIAVESGKFLNDMETAEALIHLVERDGDMLALTYVSRIFNDLHYYLVDQSATEVWGITQSYGTNREIRRLNKYIMKHY